MKIMVRMRSTDYAARLTGTLAIPHEGSGRSVEEAVGDLVKKNRALFDIEDIFLDDGCTCEECREKRGETEGA